jgi:hypothetical protein
VVRAGDRSWAAPGVIEQPRTAVPAHVEIRLDRAIAIAHHQHAFRPEVERHVIARFRDRIDVANDLPARHENALEFEPVQLRMVVYPGRQGARQFGGCGRFGRGDRGLQHEVLRHFYITIQCTAVICAWQAILSLYSMVFKQFI